jgi:hypothetical protein
MSDVNAALLEVRKKNLSQAQVDKPAEVPVEVQTAEPKSTEETSKPLAQETPKEQPKEEPTETTTEEKVENVESSWDAEEAEEKKPEPKTDYDFTQLGSALEFGEIKTKEELISKVSEIKSKLKEYEEKPLAGIPDEFKEVIEATKAGVDWKDYLSSQIIDYSKVDPLQLFEDTFLQNASRNPRYFTDGKFDLEKAHAALDLIQDPVKEMDGMRIAEGLQTRQIQKQQELRAKAEAKIAQAEKSLSTATRNLNELLPVESYGIKFEPKHSSEIYQGISSSKLTRKHLGVDYESLVRSGADMKAVTRTVAAAEYAERMIKFKTQSSKTTVKKELLSLTQNAQITTPGSRVSVEDPEKKVETIAQKTAKYIESQKQKGL